MQESELQVLPGPPKALLKRRVLEEFLRNPFLDDDLDRLARRLGEPPADLLEATAGLCQARFLKTAARGGFMLDMDLSAGNHSGVAVDTDTLVDDTDSETWVADGPPVGDDQDSTAAADPFFQQLTDEERELANEIGCRPVAAEQLLADVPVAASPNVPCPSDPIDLTSAFQDLQADSDVPLAQLLDALPYGVVAFQQDGGLETANRLAAKWLGVSRRDLDGATFEMATGVNPLPVATGGPSLAFSLTSPHPVEISVNACLLESGPGVLVSVRDVSLQEEVTRMQGLVQEELFDQFRDEMVQPLETIDHFLTDPDRRGLVRARAAMEQINWFLMQYYLREDASGSDTGQVSLGL
jgi:PAS domain-containing protein